MPTPAPASILASLLACVACCGLTAQRVWVVATQAGPGVDFTVIQAAVDAAQGGDTVLVRAGSYAPFAIKAKSLVVTGDRSVVSLNVGPAFGLSIQGIGEGQAVVLRGFATSQMSAPAFSIDGCAGLVTVEDCTFTSTDGIWPAVTVSNSKHVNLIRCVMTGGNYRHTSGGLALIGANVALHRCTATGGSGFTPGTFAGAAAVTASSSTVTLAGSTLRGGNGAAGSTLCASARPGGDALQLSDLASWGWVIDCTLQPGKGGLPPNGCPSVPDGAPIGGPGTSFLIAGPSGTLEATSPARSGEVATLSLSGPAGFGAWLALGVSQAPVYFPGCGGTIVPDLTTGVVLPLGALPASGQMQLQLPVPKPLGPQAAQLFLQMFLTQLAPTPGCFAGAPTALLLVDSRF